MGALIESSALDNVIGGQEATVPPDALGAGAYFAEVSGVSGSSPIHIAIDGTVTATATGCRKPSTWAMLVVGFIGLSWGALTRRRVRELHTAA